MRQADCALPVDEARSAFVLGRKASYVGGEDLTMDKSTQTELEAAAFRRLINHLRTRSDVQNIDMMNLAGFCRNCLSNWMEDAAKAEGVAMTRAEARAHVYGMPYEDWKAKHQPAATAEQAAAFASAKPKDH
jgi:uncharacterized protein